MKNKVTLLLVSIFLLTLMGGFVSALEFDEIDDWKTYDDKEREYTITNYFGLGKEIGKSRLITPDSFNVAWGKQRIAEFKIENGEYDYNNIIKGTELYDLKNDSNKIIRNIDYKYKRVIQIPKYSWDCPKDDGNNLTSEICTRYQDGTKDKIVWEDWTNDTLLKGENITIGIYTDVKKGDYMEWVVNIYGNERLTKWAIFNATIDVGLVGSYPTNESSGTNIKDYGSGGNDGTTNSMENEDWSGSSLVFDGLEEYANLTELGLSLNGTEELTIAFNFTPVNVSATSSNQALLDDIYDVSVRSNFEFKITSSTSMSNFGETTLGKGICNSAGSPNVLGGGFVLVNGVSHTLVQVINHSGQWSFLDGNFTDHTYCTGVNGTYFSEAGFSNVSVGAENFGVPDVFFNGSIGNINFWNRSLNFEEIKEVTGMINGSIRSIAITLNSPVNTFNTSNQTIDFNSTVSSLGGIINVTLLIDDVKNETNSSGINDVDYLFTKIFSEGSHNWKINACNSNVCTTSAPRTFEVDLSGPILNITFPLNLTYLDNLTNSTTRHIHLNYTVTDPLLDTCRALNISSGVNITLTSCLNTTFRDIKYGQYTFIVFANDTFGRNSTDSETATFDFKILENNFTSTASTIEGATERFIYDINVSAGLTVTEVNLIYNGTIFTTSLMVSNNHVVSTRDLITFQVGTQTNITFNWNITLSNGDTFNSSSHNQTVNTLRLDNCTSFTNLIYNYSIVDEELQTPLSNSNVELSIEFLDMSRSINILNFSRTYTGNPVLVCMDGNILSNTNFSVDSIAKYKATGYEIEYYNIINYTLSNSSATQNITLYDLNSSDSTEFRITFKDANFLSLPGALIFIQRQYLAENNTFKTVELPKTDSNGQTLGHFVERDVIYNLLVINGTTGEVLGSFKNIIAFCEDATIGDCTINLNAVVSSEPGFNYDDRIKLGLSNPLYNGTSRVLSVDFFTFDGSSKEINLTAFKYDQLGDKSACSSILTSSSGSISCTVPESFGNASMSVFIYVDQELIFQDYLIIDNQQDYGNEGYLILFLMILMLVMMFSESKTGMIVAVMVGLIAGVSLSLFTGKIIGLASSIIWLIIAGSILIWKLNKNN